jgi:hypothetical protein
MIFNFSLGAYYPTANFIALQIKGTKQVLRHQSPDLFKQ